MAEDEAEQRRSENAMVHDEAHRTGRGAHDDHRIDEADMVGDEHGGAFLRDVLDALGAQPVHRLDQQPGDKAEQEFRHQPVDINRNQRIEQGRQTEQGRN